MIDTTSRDARILQSLVDDIREKVKGLPDNPWLAERRLDALCAEDFALAQRKIDELFHEDADHAPMTAILLELQGDAWDAVANRMWNHRLDSGTLVGKSDFTDKYLRKACACYQKAIDLARTQSAYYSMGIALSNMQKLNKRSMAMAFAAAIEGDDENISIESEKHLNKLGYTRDQVSLLLGSGNLAAHQETDAPSSTQTLPGIPSTPSPAGSGARPPALSLAPAGKKNWGRMIGGGVVFWLGLGLLQYPVIAILVMAVGGWIAYSGYNQQE